MTQSSYQQELKLSIKPHIYSNNSLALVQNNIFNFILSDYDGNQTPLLSFLVIIFSWECRRATAFRFPTNNLSITHVHVANQEKEDTRLLQHILLLRARAQRGTIIQKPIERENTGTIYKYIRDRQRLRAR